MRFALLIASAVSLVALAACGDKTPESDAAKRLGKIPKQTIDKAADDAAAAMQRGVDRTREADEKAGR